MASLFSDSIHTTSKKGSGIGVKNVNERIKLSILVEQYGLTIHSEPDVGTEIMIRLPAIPYSQIIAKGEQLWK